MYLRAFGPALLWTLGIFILSAIPGNVVPKILDFWSWLGPDKLAHLAFYGGYAFLWLWGRKQYSGKRPRFLYGMLVFVSGMIFGIALEWLQHHYFIGRSGNVYDAAANVAGLFFGFGAFYIFFRKNEPDSKKY